MSGEVFKITDEQFESVLNYEEGHFGDVKAIEIRPARMSESVSSFANTDGGDLYIGIDEDRQTGVRSWRGFKRIEDANDHIQILDRIFPLGATYSFQFFEYPNATGYVLHIEISKTRSIIRATDGIAYIRRGAQRLPIDSDDKLRQLARNKGIDSYETETVSVEPAVITNSLTTIEFMLEVVPTAEPSEWLRKQLAIIGDLPTVAGVVLFADEPQAILPKRCGIKIYRYATTDPEGARETLSGDPVSIEGSAYEVIRRAVAKTQEIIGSIRRLGERGLEGVNYHQRPFTRSSPMQFSIGITVSPTIFTCVSSITGWKLRVPACFPLTSPSRIS